ncbi:MAG: hypothetical protein QXP59_03540 [Saccharolobus sp.]
MFKVNTLFFVNFIAVILRHKLLKIIYENGLLKNYSVEKLLLELSKIRKLYWQIERK